MNKILPTNIAISYNEETKDWYWDVLFEDENLDKGGNAESLADAFSAVEEVLFLDD